MIETAMPTFGPSELGQGGIDGPCSFSSSLAREAFSRISNQAGKEMALQAQARDLATTRSELIDVDLISIYRLRVQKVPYRNKVTGEMVRQKTLVSPDFNHEPIAVWTDAGENGASTTQEYQRIVNRANQLAQTNQKEATMFWVSPGKETAENTQPPHRAYLWIKKGNEVTAYAYSLIGQRKTLNKMMRRLGYQENGKSKSLEEQVIFHQGKSPSITHQSVFSALYLSFTPDERHGYKSFFHKFSQEARLPDEHREKKLQDYQASYQEQLREVYKQDIQTAIESIAYGFVAIPRVTDNSNQIKITARHKFNDRLENDRKIIRATSQKPELLDTKRDYSKFKKIDSEMEQYGQSLWHHGGFLTGTDNKLEYNSFYNVPLAAPYAKLYLNTEHQRTKSSPDITSDAFAAEIKEKDLLLKRAPLPTKKTTTVKKTKETEPSAGQTDKKPLINPDRKVKKSPQSPSFNYQKTSEVDVEYYREQVAFALFAQALVVSISIFRNKNIASSLKPPPEAKPEDGNQNVVTETTQKKQLDQKAAKENILNSAPKTTRVPFNETIPRIQRTIFERLSFNLKASKRPGLKGKIIETLSLGRIILGRKVEEDNSSKESVNNLGGEVVLKTRSFQEEALRSKGEKRPRKPSISEFAQTLVAKLENILAQRRKLNIKIKAEDEVKKKRNKKRELKRLSDKLRFYLSALIYQQLPTFKITDEKPFLANFATRLNKLATKASPLEKGLQELKKRLKTALLHSTVKRIRLFFSEKNSAYLTLSAFIEKRAKPEGQKPIKLRRGGRNKETSYGLKEQIRVLRQRVLNFLMPKSGQKGLRAKEALPVQLELRERNYLFKILIFILLNRLHFKKEKREKIYTAFKINPKEIGKQISATKHALNISLGRKRKFFPRSGIIYKYQPFCSIID